jgi:3-deoxy-D-manno-octulosonic-acid transferase
MALSFGFSPIFISQLPQTSSAVKPVFILDVIGRLMDFYSLADIVFVGGSIIKKGGHNILEPAVLSKPIIFGPYMFNFQDIASLFLENQASLLVHNPEELQVNIRDLLNNPAKASVLSQRAQNLVSQNQGATQRNLEYIISYIIKKESDNVN